MEWPTLEVTYWALGTDMCNLYRNECCPVCAEDLQEISMDKTHNHLH